MCKPLEAGVSACTWGCYSKCWQIKGKVSKRYHLTLWPGLVTLKHCGWMAPSNKNVRHPSVNDLIPSTHTHFYSPPENNACAFCCIQHSSFLWSDSYCFVVTPPSGILQHFTEVHTELLLDRFMKPSALLVQMTPYKIHQALWVPSSQESSHSSLSQIFGSPIK